MNGLKWLVFAVIIGLFLLILVLFTKLTIYINYYHRNDNDDLKIEFRALFGLFKYKKDIPLIKVDDDSPSIILKGKTKMGPQESESDLQVNKITPSKVISSLKNFREILEHVIQFNVVLRKFLRKVTIQQFHWSTVVGVGDAALTGMLTGGLWAVKGSIVGLLSRYFRLKEKPEIKILPQFQQMIIQTELSCMFQFRIGHAIIAGLKLVKFWKCGLPHLEKNTVLSDEKTKSV
ncbi:DUF2953 domain-containing protein [Neobacillus sp. SM06]|uniref:DUF2953 domain-containing protein n=1 Tax=Neobacillus sp. SM06 TaxID=3422492 RepID=UPI003D27336F